MEPREKAGKDENGRGKGERKNGKKIAKYMLFCFFCFLLASNDFYNAYAAGSRKLRGGSGSNKTVMHTSTGQRMNRVNELSNGIVIARVEPRNKWRRIPEPTPNSPT